MTREIGKTLPDGCGGLFIQRASVRQGLRDGFKGTGKAGWSQPDKRLRIERAVFSGGEEAATTWGIRSPGWMERGRAGGRKKGESSQFPPED